MLNVLTTFTDRIRTVDGVTCVVTRSANVGRSSLWFVVWRWMAGRGNVVRKWYSELLREG